jgi:hypothetical protein
VNTTQEYLRPAELATYLRVSKRTVWRYVKLGLLPRLSFFRVDEVRRRLEAIGR